MSGLRKAIFPASTAGFFVQSITAKDAAYNSGQDYNLGWRLSDMFSHLKIYGIDTSFLAGAPSGTYVSKSNPNYKWSIGAALNSTSVLGGASYLFLKYVKLPIPYRGMLQAAAKGALVGGAVGGALGDPAQVPQVSQAPGNTRGGGGYGGGIPSVVQLGQS